MSNQYAYYDREAQEWADEQAEADEQDALDDEAETEAAAFERWLDSAEGQDFIHFKAYQTTQSRSDNANPGYSYA